MRECILYNVLIGITQQTSKLQFGGLFDRERVGRGLAPAAREMPHLPLCFGEFVTPTDGGGKPPPYPGPADQIAKFLFVGQLSKTDKHFM